MSKARTSVAAVLWFLLACYTSVVAAADPAEDFRPALLENDFYTEGWDQLFYFPDGTLLIGQFTVTNLGIGDHNVGVLGVVVAPDGRQAIVKKSRRWNHWQFAKDQLDLVVAGNHLRGAPPNYELVIKKPEGEIELKYSAGAPPWRLGQTVQTPRDYQYINFYAPLASGQVRYRLPGPDGALGPWRELRDGVGFGIRYINSTTTDHLFHSTTRIVALGSGHGPKPVLYTVQAADGVTRIYAALFEKGGLLSSSESAMDEHHASKYLPGSMPEVLPVDVKSNGFRLSGEVKITGVLDRLDPVDLLKPYVRVFVRLFNTPLHYRYLASYDFSYIQDGVTRRLVGKALVDHMVLASEDKYGE